MVSTTLHEFHFIMDMDMKKNIMDLEMYQKEESLSGVIVKILSLMVPVIKKEHKWGEQRFSRYLPVCDDPDILREHAHAYLPENVYRKLKLMHQDLNFYSIAQLLRWCLVVFLGLIEGYRDKTFDELKRLFRQWNKENEEDSLTPREVMRQLRRIIRHLPDQTGLINIYCRNFSPFWIFRL